MNPPPRSRHVNWRPFGSAQPLDARTNSTTMPQLQSKSQPTRLRGGLAVTSAVGESAIEVPNRHATPTNKHRINAVVAFCSLSLNVLKTRSHNQVNLSALLLLWHC